MTPLWSNLNLLFLQGGSVAKRLRGVNSRFESGNGGLDTNVAIYALSLLVSVLAVIIIRKMVLWRRWVRLAGPMGLGLDKSDLSAWWDYLSTDLRQNPMKLLDSRERISMEFERLVQEGEFELARDIHQKWLHANPEIRNPRSGIDNLVQTETIIARDQKGAMVFRGFLRRVGADAVDVVPFRRLTTETIDQEMEHVELHRAGRCEPVFAKILKSTSDGRLWTFNIGEAAQVDHQRLEFRIRLSLGALVFDKRLSTLATIKDEINGENLSSHHLLAKAQQELASSFVNLMKRKKLLFSARMSHLVDLSALGARIQVDDPDQDLRDGQAVYMFMPFVINGQIEEHLVEARIVQIWQETSATSTSESHMVRLRFTELTDKELNELRRLVNVLNASTAENRTSDAQTLHDEFRYTKIS